MKTKNNAFEAALNEQRFAIADRNAAKTDRGEKAMEIYILLVSYCDPITIIFVEPLPAPATLNVTADYSMLPSVYLDLAWDNVPGATFYKVFECWVPFGAPKRAFTNLGNFYLTNLRRLVTRNRQYHYMVKAANESTESADGPTMYIDVSD